MYWADTQLVVSRAFVTIVVVGLVWPVLVSPVSSPSSLSPSSSSLLPSPSLVGICTPRWRLWGITPVPCLGCIMTGLAGPTLNIPTQLFEREVYTHHLRDAFPLPLAHCTLRPTFTTHLLASDAGATSDVTSSRLAHNTFITIARGPQAATIMTTGGGRLTRERQLGGNDPDRDDQDYDEATPTTAARQRRPRPRPRPQQLEWWRRLCGYDTHDHHGHDGYSGGRSSATTTAATTMVAVEAATAPMTRPQQRDLQQQQQQPGLTTDHEHHKETLT
ncbi:hypothetical protein EDB85DRAFT_1896077 [Lactarius pseudohatsudake]|nr:hypothetical protein EDB85DRAFT_1896077 [Lactarius pseudohatsudake]